MRILQVVLLAVAVGLISGLRVGRGLISRAIVGCAVVIAPYSVVQLSYALDSNEKTFATYLEDLRGNKLSKVTFVGIRPQSLIAVLKETGKPYLCREGFPSFDDPRSPSGPTQAIAACQHQPGVLCVQDISDALSLSRTAPKSSTAAAPKPMLAHAAYPTEYAYTKGTNGEFLVSGNDPRRGQ